MGLELGRFEGHSVEIRFVSELWQCLEAWIEVTMAVD